MKLIIKICGITSPGDARFCSRAGADRLGLIFADGPRRISIEQAASIAATVPAVALTGVFRGADAGAIEEAVQAASLTHVQLHDCPDPDEWERIAAACGRPVVPVLTAAQSAIIQDSDPQRTVLLDLEKDPAQRTDEHRRALQEAAADLAARGRPVLVAGGLDPENVRRIAHRTRCLGVDVAGGVERAPGVKDPLRVRRFIEQVRSLEFGHVH